MPCKALPAIDSMHCVDFYFCPDMCAFVSTATMQRYTVLAWNLCLHIMGRSEQQSKLAYCIMHLGSIFGAPCRMLARAAWKVYGNLTAQVGPWSPADHHQIRYLSIA